MSLFFHRSSTTTNKAMRNGSMDRQHHNTMKMSSPVDVVDATNSQGPPERNDLHPRIPMALQHVFLQSNRGEEVHVPPPKNIASRIFRTLTFRHRNNNNDNDNTNSNASRKHRNYGRNKKHPASVTTTTPDHTTNSSSSNSSSSCDDDATVIVEVNASYSSLSTSISSSNVAKNNNNNNKTATSLQVPVNTKISNATTNSKNANVQKSKMDDDIVAVHSTATLKKELTLLVTPLSYVDAILQSRGYPTTKYSALETSYYNQPTAYQQICYDTYILKLVKQTEMDTTTGSRSIHALKQLFLAGISSNPCNAHGESLLHTICRLGTGTNSSTGSSNDNPSTCTPITSSTSVPSRSYELLQLMISIGKCDVSNCVDDYGRTPLHDACWCHAICFDTIALLLQQDPTLIMLQDCRGATPLQYIPSQHHTKFMEFISQYKDQLFSDIRHKGSPSTLSFPSPLVQKPPHCRPVPDPTNALTPDVARMVVSGRITPQELTILLLQDHEEEDDDDDESESSYDDEVDEDDEVDDSSTILSTEGDLLLTPPKINTVGTARHVDAISNDELEEDDEDDDIEDEESYSDLEEMLRRLKSPNQNMNRSAAAESLQSDYEAVLGICRPQYGYEMMNTPSTSSETKKSRNSSHNCTTLKMDRDDGHNDMYDHPEEDGSTNEDAKPMPTVVIPTIHCHDIDARPSSEATPLPPPSFSHTKYSSPTKMSLEKPMITDMTNELLEFSV